MNSVINLPADRLGAKLTILFCGFWEAWPTFHLRKDLELSYGVLLPARW